MTDAETRAARHAAREQRELNARMVEAEATRAMQDGNTALVAILTDLAKRIRGGP